MVEIEYLGLFLLGPAQDPAMIFLWPQRRRVMTVFVGVASAAMLSSKDIGAEPRRPTSTGVIADVLEANDDAIVNISIDAINHGTFYATIHCESGNSFDIRSSDAVDLALVEDITIYAEESIVKAWSVPLTNEVISTLETSNRTLSGRIESSLSLLNEMMKDDAQVNSGGANHPEELGDLAVGDSDFEELMGHLGISEDDLTEGGGDDSQGASESE
ncbi:bifunctional nuclease family protein [Corynebacterium kroppenstedtii]|uniref:bifunctional nuclease family protein n=1 Tax=Corynebacterium sp. PCR 32 TaxID=3351342 RepID=UPI0030A71EF5